MTNYSGITEHRWREQPFTVWVRGEVVYFTHDRERAVAKLVQETAREKPRRA